MTLAAEDFGAFFEAVHSAPPFPWQQALVHRLAATDRWPEVLDIPTGCGKTAALDAAVFHLALRADTPALSAIRIALVVDRRLVVDDAHARAQRIAAALARPAAPVVEQVADRLMRLALDGQPLAVQRLRGGAPLESVWARSPTQPTILCSTVDQVGSRLLFRGYGVSERMAPVHAGLLGRDTLVLLDEAHLAEPFRQTLAAVRTVGDARTEVALLTATPGAGAADVFRLTAADRADPRIERRVRAPKPARLEKAPDDRLAEALADAARDIMARRRETLDTPPAVGVVVNRVALARAVFDKLARDPDAGATLMIGRSRDVDRDAIVAALAPFRTGTNRSAAERPLFIVATQCLEVGVDLDLDGLVTQAAALDALRQRFGRLDRAGRGKGADAVVIARAEDLAAKADDPVYGDRIRQTWRVLETLSTKDVVDFGVDALDAALAGAGADKAALAAPRADAPVLMPAYVDLWRRTAPVPNADPDIGLFLHGARGGSADVSLVWRRDVAASDLDGRGADLRTLFALVPPRAAEMIDLPVWTVRGWLRAQTGLADLADAPEKSGEDRSDGDGRRAFRWAGEDDSRTGAVDPDDIRPGDVIVVPAAYGGCDAFGWAPDSREPVADVAEIAAWPWRGRRWAARVPPDLAAAHDAAGGLSAALSALGARPDREALRDLAALLPAQGSGPSPAPRDSVGALVEARSSVEAHYPYGGRLEEPRGVVLLARRGLRAGPPEEAAPPASTEDDRTGTAAPARVTLDRHCADVAAWVKRYARALRLEDPIAEDLVLAARLHDLGKADVRFQTALAGGHWFNVPDGPAVAKSAGGVSREAFPRAGLPERWRHEALSVRLARAHPALGSAHDAELVLWLIGVHHGLGRPFFGFADPLDGAPAQRVAAALGVTDWSEAPAPGPQSPGFDLDGRDWPMLFDVLARRYGAWGLAHLEALLRLADHRASAEEEA